MDSNAVTRWLAVAGLTGIAIALVWKGEIDKAITVAAMITPGAVQMPRLPAPAATAAKGAS
jgi:heme/copper-type cytochrome/quinol oxidase subunit 4